MTSSKKTGYVENMIRCCSASSDGMIDEVSVGWDITVLDVFLSVCTHVPMCNDDSSTQ